MALGAALARPESANVLFIGDGGLSMVLGDLETAVRHGIGLIVIVMNDQAYGAERIHLEADGLPVTVAALPAIDFAQVGAALGVEATRVQTTAELEALCSAAAGRAILAAADRLSDPVRFSPRPGCAGRRSPCSAAALSYSMTSQTSGR